MDFRHPRRLFLVLAGIAFATYLQAATSAPPDASASGSPMAAPPTTAAPAAAPGKFTAGDNLELRVLAMQADLNSAVKILGQTPTAPHAGFVEKSIADVNQALADTGKGLAYVAANPVLNATWGWTQGRRI